MLDFTKGITVIIIIGKAAWLYARSMVQTKSWPFIMALNGIVHILRGSEPSKARSTLFGYNLRVAPHCIRVPNILQLLYTPYGECRTQQWFCPFCSEFRTFCSEFRHIFVLSSATHCSKNSFTQRTRCFARQWWWRSSQLSVRRSVPT